MHPTNSTGENAENRAKDLFGLRVSRAMRFMSGIWNFNIADRNLIHSQKKYFEFILSDKFIDALIDTNQAYLDEFLSNPTLYNGGSKKNGINKESIKTFFSKFQQVLNNEVFTDAPLS